MTRIAALSVLASCLAGCAGIPKKAEIDGYSIEVRNVEPQPVVTTRQNIKTAEMSQAFQKYIPSTWQFASQNGKVSGQPIAIYHSFMPESVDVEVGVPVEAAIEGEGDIRCGTLPGGKVLVLSHFGSYHELSRAHSAMTSFVEKYGAVRAGPCWEEDVSDPGAVAPDNVRTDVFYPIK